jgi:hypothetical protein
MVNDAGADSGVYRELDAAVRALLADHDLQPLLRLTDQDIHTGTSGPLREFNDGLYQATTCLDYPQPFSYSQTPAQRAAQYARTVAALPAGMFAPFSVHEWVTEPEEEFDACLDWPAPAHPDPPITTPPPYAPRNLPVLVLSGDLDSLTTPAEGRQTARDMGPSARWILIRNDTHVNAMDDPVGCASGLVQTFIKDPAALQRMNASCAERTPEVRVVGTFPVTLSRVTPAIAGPDDQAGRTGLRLAAAGAAAAGDAVWRWYYGDGVKGWGARRHLPVHRERQPHRDPPHPGALDVRHQGQRDRPVEPGQRPGPRAADNSRAGRDLRLHRAQVLQLRPALGGTPVWPLPGPADHRHDARGLEAKLGLAAARAAQGRPFAGGTRDARARRAAPVDTGCEHSRPAYKSEPARQGPAAHRRLSRITRTGRR